MPRRGVHFRNWCTGAVPLQGCAPGLLPPDSLKAGQPPALSDQGRLHSEQFQLRRRPALASLQSCAGRRLTHSADCVATGAHKYELGRLLPLHLSAPGLSPLTHSPAPQRSGAEPGTNTAQASPSPGRRNAGNTELHTAALSPDTVPAGQHTGAPAPNRAALCCRGGAREAALDIQWRWGTYPNGRPPAGPARGACPSVCTQEGLGNRSTGSHFFASASRFLFNNLGVRGSEGGKSNHKRETAQPRTRSQRGRAAWVDVPCLLPGTDNEALSNSCHSSQLQ